MAVDGMTCADCERHVGDALREAGTVEPTANFRNGEANFSAPTTVEPQHFVDALARTPYRAGAIERVTYERAEQRSLNAAQQTGLTWPLLARAEAHSPRRWLRASVARGW
jgi:hypothetical protein